MNIDELRERLKALAEPRFQAFAASLIPGEASILGVRIPMLRRLARQIARENRECIMAETSVPQSMEECMIRGMLPGYASGHISSDQRLKEIAAFVPLITNWSLCDSCCATYQFTRAHREPTWAFLQPYLISEHEFESRFALVMLLNHFIQERAWVENIVLQLPQWPCCGYYAEMAAAWLLCEIHLRYPDLAAPLLTPTSALRSEILTRTHRKIRESRRNRT